MTHRLPHLHLPFIVKTQQLLHHFKFLLVVEQGQIIINGITQQQIPILVGFKLLEQVPHPMYHQLVLLERVIIIALSHNQHPIVRT